MNNLNCDTRYILLMIFLKGLLKFNLKTEIKDATLKEIISIKNIKYKKMII